MSKKIWISVLVLFFIIFIVSGAFGIIKGFTHEIIGLIKFSTILQISGFLFVAILIYLLRKGLARLGKRSLDFLIILSFLFMLMTCFEMLFGFHYWFSYWAMQGTLESLDELEYFPHGYNPLTNEKWDNVNLNIMIKAQTCLFFIALYLFYTLNDVKKCQTYQ